MLLHLYKIWHELPLYKTLRNPCKNMLKKRVWNMCLDLRVYIDFTMCASMFVSFLHTGATSADGQSLAHQPICVGHITLMSIKNVSHSHLYLPGIRRTIFIPVLCKQFSSQSDHHSHRPHFFCGHVTFSTIVWISQNIIPFL